MFWDRLARDAYTEEANGQHVHSQK